MRLKRLYKITVFCIILCMTISSSIGINALAGSRLAAIQIRQRPDQAFRLTESNSTDNYTLSIDTISVYPGEQALVNMNLHNLAPISGFEILFNYDVTALSLASISNAGTRTNAFEYFTYWFNAGGIPGDVHVSGISDLDYSGTPGNLLPGDGPIFKILFYATSNQDFAGFSIPINFAFRDILNHSDNTLKDSLGGLIPQSSIIYNDGFVSILKVAASDLGDINLNGIPYEIGDVIYFINYFLNPAGSPLSPLQRANSDVNQDGYSATIADLVYIVVKIVGIGSGGPKLRYDDASSVAVSIDSAADRFSLNYDSPVNMGGATITLRALEKVQNNLMFESKMNDAGMICDWKVDGDLIRVLIYSDAGRSIPAGANSFFAIDNSGAFKIENIQVSTADGYILPVLMKDDIRTQLPEGFRLYQNYPNPFNPSTTISFDMPVVSDATLIVYDVLGREVRTLVSGQLGAGHREFIWDGKDNMGNVVSSGIYFYRLETTEYSAQKKMMFIK